MLEPSVNTIDRPLQENCLTTVHSGYNLDVSIKMCWGLFFLHHQRSCLKAFLYFYVGASDLSILIPYKWLQIYQKLPSEVIAQCQGVHEACVGLQRNNLYRSA